MNRLVRFLLRRRRCKWCADALARPDEDFVLLWKPGQTDEGLRREGARIRLMAMIEHIESGAHGW